MLKSEATRLLGGSISAAAEAIGISPQAYSQWPDDLSNAPRLMDRVQAALWRMAQQSAVAEPGERASAAHQMHSARHDGPDNHRGEH